MMNLAEFRGLVTPEIGRLSTALYFHESQLTYPHRDNHADRARDLHFAFTNAVSAHSADAVWFNSDYHRRVFLKALADLFNRMPDHRPSEARVGIESKSRVLSPPVVDPGPSESTDDGPLSIAWVSRWEHDKAPELFFDALRELDERGTDFRVRVMGERFAEAPPCFSEAKAWLGDRAEQWGYVQSRDAYHAALRDSDVVVSTALHEFFGIAIVEAALAGCIVIAPDDLAYPEVLGGRGLLYTRRESGDIADALEGVAELKRLGRDDTVRELACREAVERYLPTSAVECLDDAAACLIEA
jgi:glycosyltransferase involved in cell wall biosynthesis